MLKKDKLLQDCEEKNTFFRRGKRSPASSFTRGQITLAKLREVGAAVTGCRNIIIQFKLKFYGGKYTSFDRSVSFLRKALYIIAMVPSVDWSITIICISDLAWHRHHQHDQQNHHDWLCHWPSSSWLQAIIKLPSISWRYSSSSSSSSLLVI